MKKLFIVRHGHRLDQYCRDSWLAHPRRSENAWDMPLSPIGEINSYAAGEELVKHLPTVKKIYTSPMSRCVKTAEIISKHYPGAVIHKHYGLKEGNNIIDSVIINDKKYEETYIDIKDVESIAEEVVRVVSTICHILNESDGGLPCCDKVIKDVFDRKFVDLGSFNVEGFIKSR